MNMNSCLNFAQYKIYGQSHQRTLTKYIHSIIDFGYEITQHSLNDKPIAFELIISELTKYNMWVVRKLPKSTNYLLSNN